MKGLSSRDRCVRTIARGLLSLLLLAAPRTANAQHVATLAGSGAGGQANGPALEASFADLTSVAVDAAGVVYATENPATVRRVGKDGIVSEYFPGPAIAYFHDLTGIAVDASGVVFVSDLGDGFEGGDVLRIATDGTFRFFETPPAWVFQSPESIALDASGRLHVVDTFAGVGVISPQGLGSVRVADLRGKAIAVDRNGVVYVSETQRHRIRKVAPDGSVSTFAGSGNPGFADGQGTAAAFASPRGLAVDELGNVYVADTDNHRIRMVTPQGVVTTLAGSGVAGFADGEGRTARFDRPVGLAIDAAGNLYVADQGNHRIRKISLSRWIVPSAARVPGVPGSFWTTELTLHNRGPEAASATLRFLGNGVDTRGRPETSLSIPPHRSVSIPDVLSSAFGIADGFGAIEVLASSGQVAVRSRTSTPITVGSVGNGIPGIPQRALFTDQATSPPVLIGLREDDGFRSNLILVNAGTSPITIVARARDGSGSPAGELGYTLPPLGMVQDSGFLRRPEFRAGTGEIVSVEVSSPTPGASFTALATMIDNASHDPTTVLPQ